MRKVGIWLALLAVLLAATAASAQRMPAAPGQDRNVAEMIAACTQMMGQMQQMMGQMNRMMGMMGWRGGMMGWRGDWWFGGAWLFWLVLLALAITVVVLLVRQRPADGSSAALAVLQVRFAKGEITAEEYEQTKRILRG
jgi:putative membrane protein